MHKWAKTLILTVFHSSLVTVLSLTVANQFDVLRFFLYSCSYTMTATFCIFHGTKIATVKWIIKSLYKLLHERLHILVIDFFSVNFSSFRLLSHSKTLRNHSSAISEFQVRSYRVCLRSLSKCRLKNICFCVWTNSKCSKINMLSLVYCFSILSTFCFLCSFSSSFSFDICSHWPHRQYHLLND